MLPPLMKKTILISGENLSYILDDLEEQLQEKHISNIRRSSIESLLETFSESKGAMEYLYIIHFGLPYTEDENIALENMQKVRNGYERLINELSIGTVLLKDESDLLQIINGMLTGEMYFGARLKEGKLIPVSRKNKVKVKDQDGVSRCASDKILMILLLMPRPPPKNRALALFGC